MLAAKMSSGQPQPLAQAVGEVHPRLDLDGDGLAIDTEMHLAHQALPL
jgi:hypothetical protein